MAVNAEFWRDKTVLVTGHTGFKGSWLCLWLQQLGANVVGYALPPQTTPNLFGQAQVGKDINSVVGDIRDLENLANVVQQHKPQIVFHMAAQALVRDSYADPIGTYSTNVMGSLNVLESIRHNASVRAAVMVSSDKCYDNQETAKAFSESDPMGGHDPYSSSKGCMEILVSSYRSSYFSDPLQDTAAIATARAGNVIGGGDWAPNRLVPDILNAMQHGQAITLRYPNAVRPWQHVLEPLAGYMLLAEKLYTQGNKYAQSWNFGPALNGAKPVKWIVDYLIKKSGKNIPVILDKNVNLHESQQLKLDCTKAQQSLDWYPRWDISTNLDKVLEWYLYNENDKRAVCLAQIKDFSISKVSKLCNAM